MPEVAPEKMLMGRDWYCFAVVVEREEMSRWRTRELREVRMGS